MGNQTFRAMKTRDEELKENMADIQWCLEKMQGIIVEACNELPEATIKEMSSKKFGVWFDAEGKNGNVEVHVYLGETRMGLPHPMITLRGEKDPILYPHLTWQDQEIDLVHGDLDAVIVACEEFCIAVGRGEEFDQLMAHYRQ